MTGGVAFETTKRIGAAAIAAALLLACKSIPLTESAKRVRMLEPEQAAACRFIANDQLRDASFGTNPGSCAQRADTTMKNRVAALGGNAYVVTYRLVRPCLAGGTTLIFDAYACEDGGGS